MTAGMKMLFSSMGLNPESIISGIDNTKTMVEDYLVKLDRRLASIENMQRDIMLILDALEIVDDKGAVDGSIDHGRLGLGDGNDCGSVTGG